ncbi:MAG: hypothetical protein IJV12_00385 [Acidaminococcaceae bacterium]|nr:hypothetical protein [Acidaminococcaceae bacterium]
MAKGNWQVFSNLICGQKFYRVGRVIDTDKTVHSGNLEYSGDYTKDRSECEALARRLNQGGRKSNETGNTKGL